jgi:NitT/TauT family transport system substrate-binding protein
VRIKAPFIALLVAVLAGASGVPTRAQESPPIKIAASTNDSTTAAVYAVKAGLFKKAGLNVELTGMNSGAAVAAAVAGGSVQIGAGSLMSLITAHEKHVPFTLVANSAIMLSEVLYGALVVKKDSPIRTGRDLNGKTVATPALRDFNAISTMAWVDANGGDSSTLKFVELSAPASLQGVIDGRIDTSIIATPVLTQGLEGGQIRVLGNAFDAISKRYIYIGWFTTEDFASKNRDAIERFTRVMHDAAVYCNAHHAETADMIVEFAKIDPKVAAGMTRVMFAEYLSAPLIQPMIDVAAKYKLIEKRFDAQDLISPYALKPPR